MIRIRPVKDADGRKIGYIEDRDGQLTIRDASHKRVGYYDKHSDTTRDASNRRIAHGNVIGILLTKGH